MKVQCGLVYTVIGPASSVNGHTQGHALLHGEEQAVFADAGSLGADKRSEATGVGWHVAMCPGKRRAQKHARCGVSREQAGKLKVSVRAKVEYAFRVIKRQFGHPKLRYRGFPKNTAQLVTPFALSNIRMVMTWLMQSLQGSVRLQMAKRR